MKIKMRFLLLFTDRILITSVTIEDQTWLVLYSQPCGHLTKGQLLLLSSPMLAFSPRSPSSWSSNCVQLMP